MEELNKGSDAQTDKVDLKSVYGQGRVTGPTRRSSKGNWTEEEDKTLEESVQRFKGKCWKRIAECLPGRTDVQCLHRWQKVINPDVIKGPWTKEEDDLIIDLVWKQGNTKWSEIAKNLPGRIGKQCRERWHNHLNPEIKRSAWTKEEELTLIKAHAIYGNKWTEIAKLLHGRTENSVKNHWNCSVKKKLIFSDSGSVFYINKTEARGRNSGVSNRDSERIRGPCCESVLGNAKGKESHLQPWKQDNCAVPGEQGNHIMKPPFLTCNLINKQCQNVTNKRDSERILGPCLDLVLGNANGKESHLQPWKKEDCVVPRELANHIMKPPSLTCNLISKQCRDETNTAKTSGDRDNSNNQLDRLLENQILGLEDSDFGSQSSSSCLSKPMNGDTDNGKNQNLVDKFFGGLCYKPLKEEDLNILLSTGRFPSTDNYIRLPKSPVPVSTPQRREKEMSVDLSSSESILRSAAMNFKNTPSIIRKRWLESSASAIKSVEKRLVYAFDNACDSGNTSIGISSGIESSVVNNDSDSSPDSFGV